MTAKLIPWLALVLVLSGCQPAPIDAESGAKTTQEFTTDVVKRQDLTGYSFFDGKMVIPASAQATAFSPYDTPVLSVSTSVGKHVDRGEAIVKLTIPGADAATSAAKANVNSAKENYSNQKGDNSAPVREAERILSDARATEKAARDTIANGGDADLESATQARVAAEAGLTQAQRDLRRTLESDKMAVDQASTSLQDAKADAAKGIVRAPISGTIVTLDAKPGLDATAQQPLATIVNFEAVRVQGLVPAELKDFVTKNARVIIAMTGASSDPLDGIVLDVNVAPPSEGQEGAGYLALIQFLNPRSIAQPSIAVKRIGVKTGTVENVLVVPANAIFMKDGKSFVNVKSGSGWVETNVEVGVTDGALVEIKSGLSEGATIRVNPAPQG